MTTAKTGLSKDTYVIIATVLVAAALISAAILISTYRVHSTGTIKTLGLKFYSNADATIEASAVDWGALAPGDSAQIILWAKLNGNTPATLSLNVTDWDPAIAETYISINWDYNGAALQPGQAYPIKFTCAIYAEIHGVTTFSSDIFVTATELKT